MTLEDFIKFKKAGAAKKKTIQQCWGGIHMLDLAMWLTEQDFRPFELFGQRSFLRQWM